MLGPEAWWTVRLFCIPADSNVTTCLSKETDQYSFQTPPSDGDIFCRIREYQEAGRLEQSQHWRLRLSRGKKMALRAIELRPALLAHLDKLRAFPGLWDGFQLGCIERHLALHATEEMLCYLRHIDKTWQQITLGNQELSNAADMATVKGLELRAPAVSRVDAVVVRDLMRSGVLFSRVADPTLRIRLQDSVLRIRCIIPSIATFHENMKNLSIGMHILQDYLLDGLRHTTVYQAMRERWAAPGRCLIEYDEGMYREVTHRAPTADLAYRQVFLAALRHFPELSNIPPRCERGQKKTMAGPRKARIEMFLQGAQRQGVPRPESHRDALGPGCL